MTGKNNIPLPIRFNAFKHHRNYILHLLNGEAAEKVISLMDPLCTNYIDIYTGELSPNEITNQIISRMEDLNVLQQASFFHWLNLSSGHRLIELNDGSAWIIRLGIEPDRYVHIHPARTGKHTIRFKGSTLKTAYMLYLNTQNTDWTLNVQEINDIRTKIGLSPVKKLEQKKGITKCYRQFFDNKKIFR